MALKLFSVYILEKDSWTAKIKKNSITLKSLTYRAAILIRIFPSCLQSLLAHFDFKYLKLFFFTHTKT